MAELSKYNKAYFGLPDDFELTPDKIQAYLTVKKKLNEHPQKIDEQPRYKDPIMLFKYVEAREFIVEDAYIMVENDFVSSFFCSLQYFTINSNKTLEMEKRV